MPGPAAVPAITPPSGGSYRGAPPASRPTGLPTSSKNLSYKPPDVWLISFLPRPSPTFLSRAGYASRASPHLVAVLPAGSAVLCPPSSRAFPPQVVAPPSMATPRPAGNRRRAARPPPEERSERRIRFLVPHPPSCHAAGYAASPACSHSRGWYPYRGWCRTQAGAREYRVALSPALRFAI